MQHAAYNEARLDSSAEHLQRATCRGNPLATLVVAQGQWGTLSVLCGNYYERTSSMTALMPSASPVTALSSRPRMLWKCSSAWEAFGMRMESDS